VRASRSNPQTKSITKVPSISEWFPLPPALQNVPDNTIVLKIEMLYECLLTLYPQQTATPNIEKGKTTQIEWFSLFIKVVITDLKHPLFLKF
jgi:hypothetical protein